MARGAMTVSSLQPGRVYEMADAIPFVAYDRKIYYSIFDELGQNQLVPSEKFDILD